MLKACRRKRSARSQERDTDEVATVSFGPLAMGREGEAHAACHDQH